MAPAYAATVFLIYVAMVALHPQTPLLTDFQNWIYQGALFARHLHGLPDPYHALKTYPVPNSTLTVLLGCLQALLPLHAAITTYVLLHLTLCWFAVRAIVNATGASPLVWFIAPTGFFLGLNWWWGLMAFQLGIALLFFFLASFERTQQRGWSTRALATLSLLLLCLFFTHMVPFSVACLLLLICAWRAWRPALLLPVALPALLTLVYAVAGAAKDPMHRAGTGLPRLWAPVFWIGKLNTYLKSFGLVNPAAVLREHGSIALVRLGELLFLLMFAANLVLCGALLWMYAEQARRLWRDVSSRPVMLAFAVTIALYAVAPAELLGVIDPGSRLLQCALWPALFFCAREVRSAWTLRTVAAASVTLAAFSLFLFAAVPWSPSVGRKQQLPAPIELLARAPFDSHAPYRRALDEQYMGLPVFTTGIFTNQPASFASAAEWMRSHADGAIAP